MGEGTGWSFFLCETKLKFFAWGCWTETLPSNLYQVLEKFCSWGWYKQLASLYPRWNCKLENLSLTQHLWMHLCRVQLSCNCIFYSPSVQTLYTLVTGPDHFKKHDFQSVPSSLKEFQIQGLNSCFCSNSLSKCCRLQMSVFVSEVFTTLYMERTCANREVMTTFKAQKDLFPVFLENPQQNLPRFFCSESWKLSIVEDLRKMLRYAQNINYRSLWFHKVNFEIFNLDLLKWISSNSGFYPFC